MTRLKQRENAEIQNQPLAPAAASSATTICCRVLRLSTWSSELNIKGPIIAAKAASPTFSCATLARCSPRSAGTAPDSNDRAHACPRKPRVSHSSEKRSTASRRIHPAFRKRRTATPESACKQSGKTASPSAKALLPLLMPYTNRVVALGRRDGQLLVAILKRRNPSP